MSLGIPSNKKNGAEAEAPPLRAFIMDEETRTTLAAITASGKIDTKIFDGGISAAVSYLSQNPSRCHAIVDISDAEDPAAAVSLLLTVCPPETRVIALGTVNDVSLYRSLLDVGAADYLLMPMEPDVLQQALENLARAASVSETEPKSMRTIGIVGVRGGVGASTIAVNIAWHAANEMNRRVALLDFDVQFGTVTLALDLEPCHGMREILENPERADSLFISSAMARESDNLMVLGAEESLDSELSIDPAAVGTLLDGLDPTLEFVFIDLPRSFVVAHPGLLPNLDSIVLVVDPSLASIRDTTRLAELIRNSAPDIQIIITANKVGANKKGELPISELKRNIQMPVQHTIPWDPKIPAEAANSGKSLAAVSKRSPIVDAINRLSEGVTAAAQNDTRARGIGRWLRKS